MTGEDAKHCKTCKLHGLLEGEVICNYILIAREKRGCPPGLACNKYIKGSNKAFLKKIKAVTIIKNTK